MSVWCQKPILPVSDEYTRTLRDTLSDIQVDSNHTQGPNFGGSSYLENTMTIYYEVIPWDYAGFNLYHREMPRANSLEEVARMIEHPADSVIVVEEGNLERQLTKEEQAEVWRLQDQIRAEQKRSETR